MFLAINVYSDSVPLKEKEQKTTREDRHIEGQPCSSSEHLIQTVSLDMGLRPYHPSHFTALDVTFSLPGKLKYCGNSVTIYFLSCRVKHCPTCRVMAKDKADKVFMELEGRRMGKQSPCVSRDGQLRDILPASGHRVGPPPLV